MGQRISYEIEHLDLSEIQSIAEIQTPEKGKYIVFWWQQIAIGHVYIEPHLVVTAAQFIDKLAAAIHPAIHHYCVEAGEQEPDWKNWLQNNNLSEWKQWMARLFEDQMETGMPARVPVSVVICTRNRPALLKKCLLQLKGLTCLPEEIIVVDNAPDDDATEMAAKEFEDVIYIREPRPGLDIARNSGIATASQPIIAYVDDDVQVHPHWIYHVWETFHDPEVMAMTGLVIAWKLDTEAQVIFEKFWSFNRGYKDVIYNEAFFKSTFTAGPPVWNIGAGANMAFRSSVFTEVGNFDEMLDVGAAGCNGDSEMWFRILAKGFTIKYNPRAVVFHEHRSEMAGLRKQIFYYMRGFAAAAMSQQNQVKGAGYNARLFKWLPIHYTRSSLVFFKNVVRRRPANNLRYRTLKEEFLGTVSGIWYYLKNKKSFLSFEKVLKQRVH